MQRDLYDILLADPDGALEERIEVYHVDRVHAEREARRMRLGSLGQETAQEFIALWVWSAWRRITGSQDSYEEWLPRLVLVEPLKVAGRVDPTRPEEATLSPSSWPVSSAPAPTTG